jgi:TRAP-type C4-dicarboxylate transport system permease small subunit
MKSHISVDLVYSRFPKKLQTVLDVFLYLMSLGIWAIVTWRAFVYMQYLLEMRTVTDVQLIPVAPFQLILAIGCVMLSIALLLDLIKSVRKVFSS